MLTKKTIAIIGGGPAGLMAAEVASRTEAKVLVFDAMPSVGRKFLMAGKGGMNITHAEDFSCFCTRYGKRQGDIAPLLEVFGPDAIRQWMLELGITSFVGSSDRVFPVGMQAAPLLRAWLRRLREAGVRFHARHYWRDIRRQTNGKYSLHFAISEGEYSVAADSVVLALGGGSWAKLGSDGRWVSLLEKMGVPVVPLRPTNCGFNVAWSSHMRERFAGQPVKPIVASFVDGDGQEFQQRGEFLITETSVEGSLIYALSTHLRDAIEQTGSAILQLDLLPDHDAQRVLNEVARPRGSRSLSSHLQSRLDLKGVKMALLHECISRQALADPALLAVAIKALPLHLVSPRPLDEAISTAGGVKFEALDKQLMVRDLPGVFCAGEMLDWEAPTGGYLLTACLASGYAAGMGVKEFLWR